MNDIDAWRRYPNYRWVYNKLELYDRLGYYAKPHGTEPVVFPVVSKPIINLWGMGIGVEEWISRKDVNYRPGHLWMEKFYGDWISWDIDLKTSEIYIAQATYNEITEARPNSWHVSKGLMYMIPTPILDQVLQLQLDYTGIDRINIETIGNNIIEVHLRWSYEIEKHYNQVPFNVYVTWKDKNDNYYGAGVGYEVQKGDTEYGSDEELNKVLTNNDKPHRMSYVVHPLGEAYV